MEPYLQPSDAQCISCLSLLTSCWSKDIITNQQTVPHLLATSAGSDSLTQGLDFNHLSFLYFPLIFKFLFFSQCQVISSVIFRLLLNINTKFLNWIIFILILKQNTLAYPSKWLYHDTL